MEQYETKRGSSNGYKKLLVGFIGVLVVLLIFGGLTCALCLRKVAPGYAGIVYSMNGGLQDNTLSQGWHFIGIGKKLITYPVSTETMYLSKDEQESSKGDDSFNISTKDGKLVNVDAELSYHYDNERLKHVFSKWRGKSSEEIEATYIRARIKEAANEISSKYPVMEVYGEKRSELNKKVFEQLAAKLEEDGIILETFNFTRIEPDEQTKKAIQEKVDAQQKLEQDKIEAERQEITNQKNIAIKEAEAEAARIEAVAHAERLKINAEAEAEAIRIKAEAEAKANEALSKSLTGNVLELRKIEAWENGGQVPQVQGGNVNPIISMGE